MLKNKFFKITNRLRRHPFVAGQSHGIKPEFTFTIWRFNMYVRRFRIFIGIEMKPV